MRLAVSPEAAGGSGESALGGGASTLQDTLLTVESKACAVIRMALHFGVLRFSSSWGSMRASADDLSLGGHYHEAKKAGRS